MNPGRHYSGICPTPVCRWRGRCFQQLALVGLCLQLGAGGCALPGSGTPPAKINLRMTPTGELFVGEKPVLLEKLPQTLRAQGAAHATAVYIEVPDGVSPSDIRAITSTLATKGYSRLIFTKPRKTSATTL